MSNSEGEFAYPYLKDPRKPPGLTSPSGQQMAVNSTYASTTNTVHKKFGILPRNHFGEETGSESAPLPQCPAVVRF